MGIIIGIMIFFSAGILPAAPRTDTSPRNTAEEEAPQEQPQLSRAEQVIKALVEAYPRIVEKAEFRDNDWAVLMRGVWYYYAEGRLLPEEHLDKTDDYSPILFYNYPKELSAWKEPSPEQIARFRERDNNDGTGTQRRRSSYFYDGLWQAGSRAESFRRVKPVKFLGNNVTVHSEIEEVLSRVERHIMTAAKTDPLMESWVTNISEIHGWNWRDIGGGGNSRSYHAYGVAVDIIPKSLLGKETYWYWARQKNPEWWNIPYEDRYHPPDSVIKVFESYGFVWGGKWMYMFDTIHFEYRPEVFILSGLDLIKNED